MVLVAERGAFNFPGVPPNAAIDASIAALVAASAALAAALATTNVVLSAEIAAVAARLYPGCGPAQGLEYAIAPLAANSSVAIPGPPAGYLRCLGQAMVLPTTAVSATVGAKLQPASLDVWLPFAVADLSTTSVAGSVLTGANNGFVLGFGETYVVSNALGAGPASLFYSWVDVPADGVTLVRTSFGVAPVTIIPAPAAGFFNRVIAVGNTLGANGIAAPRQVWAVQNVDTVAAQVQILFGATMIARCSSTAASGNTLLALGFDTRVTTDPLRLSTRLATTTRLLNVFLAYETLPIAA